MTRLLMTCSFMVVLSAATYSQEPAAAAQSSNSQVVLVTTIIGFLTLIATNVFALYREARNRKWDQEERDRARREQQMELVKAAEKVAAVVDTRHEEMKAEISKNTEITEEVGKKAEAAFDAANNFNNKLAEVRAIVPELNRRRSD